MKPWRRSWISPKIVVLDLMLPGQSGLHVCREIRNLSDTPIVILTARKMTWTISLALSPVLTIT